MSKLSRRTTIEFVGSQRRAYAQLKTKASKSSFIDALCQSCVFERKYVIKMLTGNRKYKAREFSYDAQIYLLMLGQMLHLFSLNELVDVSQIYASELSRIRGIVPAKLNTFSHANRTRNPEVIEKFFWHVHDMVAKKNPTFTAGTRKGPLAKFRSRGIYAIDSSTIRLAYWCISWAKHRQKKAAVKRHMVASVPSRLPHFCVIDRAREHDSKKEDELLASLKEGDIAILDRAYNAFPSLCRHHKRGGFFVVREKDRMKMRVVRRVAKKKLPEGILADETIRLTGARTSKAYPWRSAALLTHLVPRYLKFKSGANCSYTRFVGLVRAVVWLKKDFLSVLCAHGIAPGGNTGESHDNMPYLRGFEKYFAEAVG